MKLHRPIRKRKAPAELSAEAFQSREPNLALDDVDDFVGLGPDDDVAAAHQDDLVTAPFRIDFDDPRRNRIEGNRPGTRVPTEILKLTLVVSLMLFSDGWPR